MSSWSWVIAMAAAVVAAAVTGWVRRQALARRWLDIPTARSSHQAPTPRGGGLAIVIASAAGFLGLWAVGASQLRLTVALLGGGLMVAWIGFRDDRKPVRPAVRLAVHLAAAAWALVWLDGVPPVQFGTTMIDFGIAGYVLGVLAIGWVVNLFNFMDGIDGIAAGEAIFIALAGALLAGYAAVPEIAAASVVFAAACLGFLAWNWPPARIFMGDVGSGYLGYVISVLALAAMAQSPVALFVWLTLGAVFFVDATVTLARRLLRGDRAHEAHRSHAYQWLARRWGNHRSVTRAVLWFNIAVLLPIAWFCAVNPGLAFPVTVAIMAFVAAVALFAGSGRAEPPGDAAQQSVRAWKE